jgi:16S rRNA processing protein RimM
MNKHPDDSRLPANSSTSAGSDNQPTEPYFFVVGEILRPHGVRGELRVSMQTHHPDWVAQLDELYVGTDPYREDNARAYVVKNVRTHRDYLLVTLAGIQDRNAADLLRGKLLMMRIDQGLPLEDDEIYLYQLIGMAVYTDTGEYLGDVMEIIETGANDVYVIQGGVRGDVLIPDIDEVVLNIDSDTRQILIHPLLGLLPDTKAPSNENDDNDMDNDDDVEC